MVPRLSWSCVCPSSSRTFQPHQYQEESFSSMVLSWEVKASEPIKLAGDWGLLETGSLWRESELLFLRSCAGISRVFPFIGETGGEVKGALDLPKNRCSGGLLPWFWSSPNLISQFFLAVDLRARWKLHFWDMWDSLRQQTQLEWPLLTEIASQ